MREKERARRPSPAMIVAIVALVFALAGTGVASVATISALSKKEKKQTRNIARDEIAKGAQPIAFAHVSAAGSVDALRAAKAKGVRASGETAPHYIALTDEAGRRFRYEQTIKYAAELTPPLSPEEAAWCRQLLQAQSSGST